MKNTNWLFPLISPRNQLSIEGCVEHIRKEVTEFEEEADPEKKMLEAVDIVHTTETFIRQYCALHNLDFETYRVKVIEKNTKRGYYQ